MQIALLFKYIPKIFETHNLASNCKHIENINHPLEK